MADGDVFKERKIGALNNSGAPALITLTGGGKELEVMVTELDGAVAENFQVLKSFDESVYVTLFGQALTRYRISCTTIPNKCEDVEPKIKTLADMYKSYRLGNAEKTLITITMDDLTIQGFLTEMPIRATEIGNGTKAIVYTLVILGQAVLT